MANNDNEGNVSTTGSDKEKRKQDKQAKKQNTDPVKKQKKLKNEQILLKKLFN